MTFGKAGKIKALITAENPNPFISHLLQALTVPSYINNDTFIIGGPGSNLETRDDELNNDCLETLSRRGSAGVEIERPSTLIMTGLNYSGKSVYLQQIALIVYMAHIGSFVPAEAATIGLTDKILTRISTRETVSKFQSAFSIDLQQIAWAMATATRRSLIVIDEFGKGTEANSRLFASVF